MYSNSFISRRTSASPSLLSSGRNVSELISNFEVKQREIERLKFDERVSDTMAMSYGNTRVYTKYGSRPMPPPLLERNNPSLMSSITSLDDSDIYSDDRYDHHPFKTNNAKTMNDIDAEQIVSTMGRLGRILQIFAYIPLFGMSITGMGISFLIAVFICPRAIGENLLFPAFRLLFGTLYPAYASYKAVRTKNVKEYVKWMMYWIVYALFTCIETFTDIFLSWFPFYYEVKVILVIWLLSPATKGSSTLYRKFVHPMLTRREQEIDEYINQAKEKGYTAVLQLGSKGVNYATNVIMQTALKGGGNLVQTIRRSYSLSDLSEPDIHRTQDEIDTVARPQRLLRPRTQTARSSSGGRQVDMYFSEVDVGTKTGAPNYNYIRSSEDISSGYSSAEPISGGLSRTSSMTNATRTRLKAKRAEGELYLESAEYETIQTPPYGYPQIMELGRRNPTYDSDSDFIPHSIEEYSKEAFVGNKRFIQEVAATSQPAIVPENLPKTSQEKYALFCRWLDDQAKRSGPATETERNDNGEIVEVEKPRFIKEDTQKVKEIQNDILTALIKESDVKTQEIKEESRRNSIESQKVDIKNLGTHLSQEDDEFHDTLSQGSDGDMFSDANEMKETVETPVETPTVVEEVNTQGSKDVELKSEKKDEEKLAEDNASAIQSITLHTIENLVKNINQQLQQETSLLKRPVSHSKGKAPSPPDLYPLKTSSSWTNVNTTFTTPIFTPSQHLSTNFSSSISSLSSKSDISPSTKNTDYLLTRKSVTPEPSTSSSDLTDANQETTKKQKRSLFRNYLPSIFRSESPKNLAPRDETKDEPKRESTPKETQI